MKNIRNNKDLFDDKELPEGHLARFEALLDKQNEIIPKKAKRISMPLWISIAASVVIVVVSGLYFYSNGLNTNAGVKTSSETEFYTANEFYKQQMNEYIADIRCKLDQADSVTRQRLMSDLQRIQKENEVFINEMKNNKNEEIAIYYMVQHYNSNIQALEFINNKLGKHIQC